MQNNVTIGDKPVDADVLRGYASDSFDIQSELLSYKEKFKTLVDDAAEATGLEKKVIAAYFKARFQEKTKEATERGQIFEQLDQVLS